MISVTNITIEPKRLIQTWIRSSNTFSPKTAQPMGRIPSPLDIVLLCLRNKPLRDKWVLDLWQGNGTDSPYARGTILTMNKLGTRKRGRLPSPIFRDRALSRNRDIRLSVLAMMAW